MSVSPQRTSVEWWQLNWWSWQPRGNSCPHRGAARSVNAPGWEDPFLEESENIYKTSGTTAKTTQPLDAFVMEAPSPSVRDTEEVEKRNFLLLSLPFFLLNGSTCGPPGVRARTKVTSAQPPLIQPKARKRAGSSTLLYLQVITIKKGINRRRHRCAPYFRIPGCLELFDRLLRCALL